MCVCVCVCVCMCVILPYTIILLFHQMSRLILLILLIHGVHHGASALSDSDLAKLKRQYGALARQVMNQQLFNEERIRSEGNSGIKALRQRHQGQLPFYGDSFTGGAVLSIHDHPNFVRTVGMGEFIAVLNGVEFRTRHNDYAMYMPSRNSSTYHEVEKIGFPDVPQEVLNKSSVDEQIDEMRLCFKAFKDSDKSTRDYRKYFKPVLCYLEGAWTNADPHDPVDEPFKSARHIINAADYIELNEKIMFTSYTGSKDHRENLAYLPTTILRMLNDTHPLMAQWNYRIMCHPLNNYLEVNRLRVVDDLGTRMARSRVLEKHAMSRAARFQLNAENKNDFTEGFTGFTHLDRLMYEIPGKDNYRRSLKEYTFDYVSMDYRNAEKKLNAARYSRMYQISKKGASGVEHARRSFSDETVYMAMNTQKKIAEQWTHDKCKLNSEGRKSCEETYKQRWSYAIPLEIVYLTPLSKWNPYDIRYSDAGTNDPKRNGGFSKDTAYDGSNSKAFYQTPSEFYTGKKDEHADKADTSGHIVGVLDKKRRVKSVAASGIYINLPEIPGVGVVRTRYPIAPVHQEGAAVWKELSALKDLILRQDKRYENIRAEFGLKTDLDSKASTMGAHKLTFRMKFANAIAGTKITAHTHTLILTAADMKTLKAGRTVSVVTSSASGHSHSLTVSYDEKAKTPYSYTSCDGKELCFDKHGVELSIVDN